MAKIFVLLRGQAYDDDTTEECVYKAFRTEKEVIGYIEKSVADNTRDWSATGYVRVPASGEYVEGARIYVCRSNCGAVGYYRYEICELEET